MLADAGCPRLQLIAVCCRIRYTLSALSNTFSLFRSQSNVVYSLYFTASHVLNWICVFVSSDHHRCSLEWICCRDCDRFRAGSRYAADALRRWCHVTDDPRAPSQCLAGFLSSRIRSFRIDSLDTLGPSPSH